MNDTSEALSSRDETLVSKEDAGWQMQGSLDIVLDIPVTLSLELGRRKVQLGDLLGLEQGSVIKLDRQTGEPLDLYVNGRLLAKGEVVVVNETLGVRVTDILSTEERLKRLR